MITVLDSVLFVSYFILLFLSIFWLIVLFTAEDNKKPKKLENNPPFSVIVPAFNEQESVTKTLKSLVELDYPKELIQIIVVNDGSYDNTAQLVEKFILENPLSNIKLLNQHNQGKGCAMNHGIKYVTGKYFACLDADSFVAPDALQHMLPELEEDLQVAAVCPLLKVQKPSTILQKVQWCEYIINMFHRDLNAKLDCVHVTPGPFSIYRTSVIKDLGGFNEVTITEDLEIAIRLQKHHYKIVQNFNAIVETVAPTSWKQLFNQRVRWYKGAVDNTINYKKLLFNKKYGDFGMLRMPTIVLGGALAVILFLTVLQSLLSKLSQNFQALQAINFDIITLIKNFTISLNWLNFPIFKITLAVTLFAISFFVMVSSFKLVREKITRYGRTWISLITYLFIYGVFLSTVWMYIAYIFVRRKKNTWMTH